ncbi:BTBD1_2 [Mytilus edulis]|uniref:BTBD1_2 n=1 Tax=Mytilus edulis TaxID=6550 RepID=A0A8S3VSA0_MYTED|nr:BTBD1_2 [Mytilus edulis]
MDTITGKLSQICLTEDMADVVFSFKGENVARIPAHKMILALRSPVFKAMFYGSFPQSKGDIKIEDIVLEIFQRLVNNAKFFTMDKLQTNALKFIADNAIEVLKSEDFLCFLQKNLVDILELDSLRAEEVDVIRAVLRSGYAEEGTVAMDVIFEGRACKLPIDKIIPQNEMLVMTINLNVTNHNLGMWDKPTNDQDVPTYIPKYDKWMYQHKLSDQTTLYLSLTGGHLVKVLKC